VSEYIKFTCEHKDAELAPFAGLDDLNVYRIRLRKLGFIGVDSNGVGFGNLSIRDGVTNSFYITGSKTGGIANLTPADCARVVAYDFHRNWLRCQGLTIASSESLTHAAVYQSEPNAGAVIHCHDQKLWTALINHIPTTSAFVAYGTPEMAREVERLFRETDLRVAKIFVMAGHQGGIVTFGANLEEAFGILTRLP
jgi:L-ribulose-5-phosphate 4-epimerase